MVMDWMTDVLVTLDVQSSYILHISDQPHTLPQVMWANDVCDKRATCA